MLKIEKELIDEDMRKKNERIRKYKIIEKIFTSWNINPHGFISF